MEKNYELELYKLIVIPDEDDRDILYVNKFDWVNNNEFCIWVNISIIGHFIEKLKDIFGYSFFDDDGGIEASIGCDEICINLAKACDRYDVNFERMFPKNKYTR